MLGRHLAELNARHRRSGKGQRRDGNGQPDRPEPFRSMASRSSRRSRAAKRAWKPRKFERRTSGRKAEAHFSWKYSKEEPIMKVERFDVNARRSRLVKYKRRLLPLRQFSDQCR